MAAQTSHGNKASRFIGVNRNLQVKKFWNNVETLETLILLLSLKLCRF